MVALEIKLLWSVAICLRSKGPLVRIQPGVPDSSRQTIASKRWCRENSPDPRFGKFSKFPVVMYWISVYVSVTAD
jgi:hypothetical protein